MATVIYQFNLARERVWPLESRRRRLRWYLVYLVLASVAIGAVVQDVVRRDRVWRQHRTLVTAREQRVLAAHPGYTTVAAYECNLEERLAVALRDLECLRSFHGRAIRPATILAGVMEPLPAAADLGTAELDMPAGTLRFDVVVQDDARAGERISPPQLAAAWERFPVAGARLSKIEAGNSERTRMDGLNVICWRFTAVVGE